MKRWIGVVVSGVLVLGGMGSTAWSVSAEEGLAEEEIQEETENEEESAEEEKEFDTEGYLYDTGYGDTMYFAIVKNNTGQSAEIHISGTAYDEADKAIGAANGYIDVIGPEEESIAVLYFDGVENIDRVDYTVSSSSTFYEPVIDSLEVEESINDRNITVKAVNNGEYAAQFVEVYALFFDADDNVISYASEYLTDSDYEIKVGASQSAQLTTYETFDHVEYYMSGRSDGSTTAAADRAENEEFSVKEYAYATEYGDYLYYLAITNNSEEAVGITGNATVYDADGKVIGAGNCYYDVLGPEEEGLTYFYFDSIGEPDHVEYQLDYYTNDLYYEPVVKDIAIEESVNPENVVLQLTNNGENAAEFVEVTALFLDENDQIITYDTGYVMDGDEELKPGATLSVQLNAYESFDHVEWFVSGRHTNY